MVLDHRISRRQLLKSGAAGAAAATLATLGPTVALGAGRAKLIPEDKVGTITFTQRDVPGRIGIAASAAAGVAPTMGNLGGADIFTNPNSQGPLVPLPGGWKELFEFLATVGIKQVEFAGYSQNAANPGGAQPPIAPQTTTTRRSSRPTSTMAVPCAASSTSSAWRQSATTGSSRTRGRAGPTAGCPPPTRRATSPSSSSRRSSARPTWAPATTRPAPTPERPRHGPRRREVGGAQRVEHQLVRHPALPAQPCRGVPLPPGRSRWSTITQDRVDREPDHADAGPRRNQASG